MNISQLREKKGNTCSTSACCSPGGQLSQRKPSAVVQRLEAKMLEAGIPSKDIKRTIAKVCGVTYQSVFHWFTGRTRIPQAEYLARLARTLDLDLVWIILGDSDTESVS